MIGGILVKVAFITCLAAIVLYYRQHRTGSKSLLRYARVFYITTVLTVFAIAGVLLHLILTHQFQYTYVWSYSSRALPLPLLISTFYAGQEGSFTLWTVYSSLIALFLMWHSSRKGYEAEVMCVFGLIELMLLLMLIVKSPFLYVWESWPGQVHEGFVPNDGRGLNPLLQNYWMVIHPQVLFTGFSVMGVPFAYAVAAMLKRDYANWIRPATPWIAVAGLVLGTGIMMGGFWAYETLGWGGYWGWDPVENSSLVPWLFAIASLHTILSQRKSGGFMRTNLILGMLCFIMVLYSTFLTRSGVLGDTSVHSFVDPGMWAYWLLIGMIVLFVGLGGGLFLRRMKEIPRPKVAHHYYSREFALFLGATAIVCAAIFIVAGTSSPIITDILYGKKSAVETSYYVSTTMPIGICIGLLAGVGQLLWWTRSDKSKLLKNLLMPFGLAVIATLGLAFGGAREPLVALFILGASFALFANIQVAWRIFKGNPKFAGGSIAHVGLAIMFFGFVASSKYDHKETVSLKQGTPVDVMDYRLTYEGYRPIDAEKYAFRVRVHKNEQDYVVAPVMYYSAYNDGLMRNPDILNLYTKDFYLAPLSLEQKSEQDKGLSKAELKRGETKKIGNLEITFVDFDFPVMQKAAMLEGKEVKIGAKLQVRQNSKEKPKLVVPAKIINEGQTSDKPADFENRFELTIVGMRPDRENKENSRVEIGVRSLQAGSQNQADDNTDTLVAEASVKPFINLVWSGLIVLLVGFVVTIVRRAQEARLRNDQRPPDEGLDSSP